MSPKLFFPGFALLLVLTLPAGLSAADAATSAPSNAAGGGSDLQHSEAGGTKLDILPPDVKRQADAVWEKLEAMYFKVLDYPPVVSPADRVRYFIWEDDNYRHFYEQGLEFFHAYPTDYRRWNWYLAATAMPPRFFKDPAQGAQAFADGAPNLAEVDQDALGKWKGEMAQISAELKTSPQVNGAMKARMYFLELAKRIGGGQPEADALWATLPWYFPEESAAKYAHGYTGIDFHADLFRRRQKLRDLGMLFYDRFPNDPRLWVWMQMTLQSPASYFRNCDEAARAFVERKGPAPAIDDAAKGAWLKLYQSELRPKYILAAGKLFGYKGAEYSVRYDELVAEEFANDLAQRIGEKVDLTNWKKEVLSLGADAMNGQNEFVRDMGAPKLAGEVFYYAQAYRQSESMLLEFADELLHSPNPNFRSQGEDEKTTLAFAGKPIEISATAIDGRPIDLAKMRGKVVLVDLWATWCAPCLLELPYLKENYAKYKDAGFEIVGVSLNSEKERARFNDLVKRESISWPQIFDPTFKGFEVLNIGVAGTLLLFDQKGFLVAANDEITGTKLDPRLRKLLGLPPDRK